MNDDKLEEYEEKRDFEKTPEPPPESVNDQEKPRPLAFVVQKHLASHLHYDLRLEVEGVLKSWAVPKGPSLNPEEKHLAVMVEDHPFDYRNFEGVIPEGNYGAGPVMIWDEGTFLVPGAPPKELEGRVKSGIEKGRLTFVLNGKKLKGEFALVKIKRGNGNNWLLIKKQDQYAGKEDVRTQDRSAVTGRSMEEIAGGERKSGGQNGNVAFDLERVDLSGARKSEMPKDLRPMLAYLVTEPFDRPGWLFEIKWDGYRTIAEVQNKTVRLYSRNRKLLNEQFPPVAASLSELPYDAVFDGEVVVIDETGRADFQLLQNYGRTREGHLVFYVFDLLYFNGYDLKDLPLKRRKEILRQVLPDIPYIRISDHVEEQGLPLFKAVAEQGVEGIVAKSGSSTYQPGIRSRNWIKVKASNQQEAVICGFTEPKGGRKGFGALVLGVYEDGDLNYIGHTGTGFSEASILDILSKLEPIEIAKSPFKEPPKTNMPVRWVEPKLVCEIRFTEWTQTGQMRHPVFLGLREDLQAENVRREIPVGERDMEKEREFLDPEKKEARLETDGKVLRLTNLDKVLWPREGYTKRDLIEYYHEISGLILPYLKNRPESLHRRPNGIEAPGFFQKDMDDQPPDWVETVGIYSESSGREINYLLCQDEATLLYMANLACIELNPWNSRAASPDRPDYLVLDLDPLDISFERVVETALVLHDELDKLGIPGFCKTSGATGLHIYVPLGAKYTYDEVQQFSRILALRAYQRISHITSLERSPEERRHRVYLDTLQNRRGQTMAAPYSLRPRPGAPVSTPLKWDEVRHGLNPDQFNLITIKKRIDKMGDLWEGVSGAGIDIESILNSLDEI